MPPVEFTAELEHGFDRPAWWVYTKAIAARMLDGALSAGAVTLPSPSTHGRWRVIVRRDGEPIYTGSWHYDPEAAASIRSSAEDLISRFRTDEQGLLAALAVVEAADCWRGPPSR